MSGKFHPWRDYLETIFVAVFLALMVRTFIFAGYKVPTGSMAPTLLPGDFIFAYRLPFGVTIPFTSIKVGVQSPAKGDVVVFTYLEQPQVRYVKRVVGLPGDQIRIINGELIINDQKLQYEQVSSDEFFKEIIEQDGSLSRHLFVQKDGKSKSFGPIVVPPNEVFVLGDNRDSSDDSRYWGSVPIERIESRVVLIWLSLDWKKKVLENRWPSVRWDRVMKRLD